MIGQRYLERGLRIVVLVRWAGRGPEECANPARRRDARRAAIPRTEGAQTVALAEDPHRGRGRAAALEKVDCTVQVDGVIPAGFPPRAAVCSFSAHQDEHLYRARDWGRIAQPECR